MIAVHELLADFDFQRSKVNFYELKSVVARLIDGTSENEKIRLVAVWSTMTSAVARKVIRHVFQSTSMRVINTYIFICCFMCDRSTSQAKRFL